MIYERGFKQGSKQGPWFFVLFWIINCEDIRIWPRLISWLQGIGNFFFLFLQFLRKILTLCRINDVLEQQFKHTKGKNFLEQHPPKEVGLHPHSIKAKNEIPYWKPLAWQDQAHKLFSERTYFHTILLKI